MSTAQHKTPCKDCPFSRQVKPGALGGSDPLTYLGQAYGPFLLPCHSRHDYTKLEARLNPENAQCAGAAIHRANIGRADLMPDQLLHLPADTEKVFATQAEFLAHHTGAIMQKAEEFLSGASPNTLMEQEFRKAQKKAAQGKAFIRQVRS